MNSIKCRQCGFTNWATAENCKKCNSLLGSNFQETNSSVPKLIQNNQTPSFFQVIKNDFLSFLAIILPIVGWGIYIAVAFFGISFTNRRSGTVVGGSGDNFVFIIIALVFTILGISLLHWRVSSIQNIFKSGERVMGKITNISFFKDRGRIEFSYNYSRQNFQNGSAIMKNSKTQSYRNGDEVVLIVDSNDPNRVLIQDLYI
jgi:hypothetical protein